MSKRRRRALINTRWYRVKLETHTRLIIGRLHRAIKANEACLFYTDAWMQQYRSQSKRFPLLRRFRPKQAPPVPLETTGEGLPESLHHLLHQARSLGYVVILLDTSGRIRYSSVDDLHHLPITEADTPSK